MSTVILQGVITPEGRLEINLPAGLEPGPVEVEIRKPKVTVENQKLPIRGITLGEILESGLVGMWADRTDIQDSVEFARQLRRRASRRNPS